MQTETRGIELAGLVLALVCFLLAGLYWQSCMEVRRLTMRLEDRKVVIEFLVEAARPPQQDDGERFRVMRERYPEALKENPALFELMKAVVAYRRDSSPEKWNAVSRAVEAANAN